MLKILKFVCAWVMALWLIVLGISGIDYVSTGNQDALLMIKKFLFLAQSNEHTKVYQNEINTKKK